MKDLSDLFSSVTDWHTLGVKLRVPMHELDIIQRNHPGDATRRKHEVINRCLRSATPPTWRDFYSVLDQMGEHRCAEEMQKPTEGISASFVLFL